MGDAPEPTPLEREAREHYDRILRPVYGGRKWLVVGGPIAGLAKAARPLHALGAASTFLLGDGMGTGDPPDPAHGPWRVLPSPGGPNLVEAMWNSERALLDLPADAREALDAWDPDRSARAYGMFTLRSVDAVAGRRRFAIRPDAWAALEDKTLVEEFWDAAGVRRAPSEVVPADGDSLRAAARRLDRGVGTAWAGDAKEGLHGAGVYLRWIRTPGDEPEALAFFGARCDRVRVMPFLEGIPCSIHGVVFPGGGVSIFRPVEMVILRRPGSSRLFYGGAASWFDPAPADREAMRNLGRRVAEALRDRVGFLGGFTVDGVLAEEGFLPTELNARLGAGHTLLAGSLKDFPFQPLALAAAEGLPLDWRPELLEEAIVEAADRTRGGGTWTPLPGTRETTEKFDLAADGDSLRPARDGEPAVARGEIGQGQTGLFLRILPTPGCVPTGPALAPWAVKAMAAADARFGLGLGPLEAARAVR
jgi:hypothetical protein